MDNQNLILKNVLVQNKIDLPGSDLMRTGILIFFQVLLLFLITFFIQDIAEIKVCRNYSYGLIFVGILLSGVSMMQVYRVQNDDIKEFDTPIRIFYAKISISISGILTFTAVCLWVLFLGGVLKSPFASTFSISPLLITVQYFRDKDDFHTYERILCILSKHSDDDGKYLKWGQKFIQTTRPISIVPIVIVILTITVGEFAIARPIYKVLGSILELNQSNRSYYIIYYLSVFIATSGVIPKKITKKITRQLGF